MGKIENLVIVKLGGSAITDKDKPLTSNIQNIDNMAEELAAAMNANRELNLVIIHGGGSFGHYYAKKYGLGTSLSKVVSGEGIGWTAAGMIRLHAILLEQLCKSRVFCSTILPNELLTENQSRPSVSGSGIERLFSAFANRLVPITFGFVNVTPEGAYIISGDAIALAIARTFAVKRTVFAMDVDGVYSSPDLKGKIIPELNFRNSKIVTSRKELDVTGGIEGKISTSLDLADLGSDACFVNGSVPGRLSKAINGSEDVVATRIYSTKKSRPHS